MKTVIKWVVRIFLSIVMFALILPVAATLLVDQNDVKRFIEKEVQQLTGRKLNIKGAIGFYPGLNFNLFAKDVEYENADWSERPLAVTVEKLDVTISLSSVLRQEIVVNAVKLVKPDVWIEFNDQGELNLIDPSRHGAAGTGADTDVTDGGVAELNLDISNWFNLKQLEIEDGQITYAYSRRNWEIQIDNGRLQSNAVDKPLAVQLRGNVQKVALDVDGTLGTLSTWLQQQPSNVFLQGSIGEQQNRMSVEGVVDNVLLWRGLNVDVVANVSQVLSLSNLFYAEPLDIRNVRAKAKLLQPGNVDTMSLSAIQGDFEFWHLPMAATGVVQNLSELKGIDLTVTADDAMDFAQSDIRFPVNPHVRLQSRLYGSSEILAAAITSATLATDSLTLNTQGQTDNIFAPWEQPLQLVLSSTNLKPIGDEFALSLPDLGELSATAVLKRVDKEFQLQDISVVGEHPDFSWNVEGEIESLASPDEFALQVSGQIPNIESMAIAEPWSLPALGGANATGTLKGEGEGVFHLLGVNARLTDSDQKIDVEGDVRDIGGAVKLQLNTNVNLAKETWSGLLPGDNPLLKYAKDFGYLTGKFSILSEDALNVEILDVDLQVPWSNGQVSIKGSLPNTQPSQGQFQIHYVSETFEPTMYQHGLLSEKYLRGSWHADIKGDVGINDDTPQLEKISAFLEQGASQIQLTADIGNLTPFVANKIVLDLKSPDIGELLPGDIGLNSGLAGGATLRGRASESEIKINGEITIANSDLIGELLLGRSGNDPFSYRITSESKRLDLEEIFVAEEKSAQFFNDSALIPKALRSVNGEAIIKASHFNHRTIELSNIELALGVKGNDIQATFKGMAGGGPVELRIIGLKNGVMELNLHTQNIPASAVKVLSKNDTLKDGNLSVDVQLQGKGVSLADLAIHGTGHLRFGLKDAKIYSNTLNTVGGDILNNFARMINPFREKEPFINVECGVINFALKEGKAITENGLAMKTNRVTLLGTGEVGFPKESIRVVIAPKPRRGLGISPATIAKLINVGGTLSAPKITTDTQGWLKTGATIGAAIASSGVSLLVQGLFDRVQADKDVCAIANGIDQNDEKADDKSESKGDR